MTDAAPQLIAGELSRLPSQSGINLNPKNAMHPPAARPSDKCAVNLEYLPPKSEPAPALSESADEEQDQYQSKLHDDNHVGDLSDDQMDSFDDSASKTEDWLNSESGEKSAGKKEGEDDNTLIVYHCWLCYVEFIDKVGIIRHLQEWHKDRQDVQNLDRLMKVPVCLECGVQGPCEHQDGERQEDDDTLMAYMYKPRFLNCSICQGQFLDSEALRTHRSESHPEEPAHQCTYCPEAFRDHPSLVAHNHIHLGSRPYICQTCGNRFAKLSDLKRHEQIHSGVKPYKCLQCNQSFTQKSSLEKHAKIHARRTGRIACLQCGLLFKEKEALKEHAMAEHKGSNFQCQTCGKMYSEERWLLLHEKTHDADLVKPYACQFCDRRFTLHHMLVKHEKKSHLAKREIKCHLCHKLFKRNENLTRHMLSHSGVKNFQCSECGVGFTEKGSLTRHFKAQHQQLRPHACPICRRGFTRKNLVRKHVERFHVQKARELVTERNKFFRCRLCLKLLRKTGRRQHERHHRSKGDKWEGSLEEELEPEGGEEGEDLEKLLGPEVAKLISKKGADESGGSNGGVGDGGDDDEEEDEDEDEEDKNEDDDEFENNEEEEEIGQLLKNKKGSSNAVAKSRADGGDHEQGSTAKMETAQRGQDMIPVFPERLPAVRNNPDLQRATNALSATMGSSRQQAALEEDPEDLGYRKIGVMETRLFRTSGVMGDDERPMLESRPESQDAEMRELQYKHKKATPPASQVMAGSTSGSLKGKAPRNGSIGAKRRKSVPQKDMSSRAVYMEETLRQQMEADQRNLPIIEQMEPAASNPTYAMGLSRFQSEREAIKDNHYRESSMLKSRSRDERGTDFPQGNLSVGTVGQNMAESGQQRGIGEPYYQQDSLELSRRIDRRDDGTFNSQYREQDGDMGSSRGYQHAEQRNLRDVADQRYRESPYAGDIMDQGYSRYHAGSSESQQRDHQEVTGEDGRFTTGAGAREADGSAYDSMADARHVRGQQPLDSSQLMYRNTTAAAGLTDPRYREAAAAYALMGMAPPGYPAGMIGSARPATMSGQGYLGAVHPSWYSETAALTHAMMGSTRASSSSSSHLQGDFSGYDMGSGTPHLPQGDLAYAMGSRLSREPRQSQQGGSIGDGQQYRSAGNVGSIGNSYREDGSGYPTQEMLSPKLKDFDRMGGADANQRYRNPPPGDMGVEHQYRDHHGDLRDQHFRAQRASTHGLMEQGAVRDERRSISGDPGYLPSNSAGHSQAASIHRTWT